MTELNTDRVRASHKAAITLDPLTPAASLVSLGGPQVVCARKYVLDLCAESVSKKEVSVGAGRCTAVGGLQEKQLRLIRENLVILCVWRLLRRDVLSEKKPS